MPSKLYILKCGHKLNSKPGTMWDVFRYYNKAYETPYTGEIGRIYKRVDGKYTTNKDSKVFSTKESAANHLLKLNEEWGRSRMREGGTWDHKTEPPRTLKSYKTKRLRSYEDDQWKTPTGRKIRYKLERK